MKGTARTLALLMVACACPVAHAAQDVRVPLPAQPAGNGIRLSAGALLAERLGAEAGPVRALGGAWLASQPGVMQVVGTTAAASEAVCADAGAVRARISQLAAQVAEFGPPVVLVEAERPENPDDRRVAAQLQQSLAECGLVAVDAEAARARRRSRADAAVEHGMDAAAGRAVIDRPDVDFVLRVRRGRRDEAESASYGITLAGCEVTVAPTLLRIGDQSSVPAAPAVGVARSRSARAAEAEAERQALAAATSAVVAAVASEWVALAAGERPWIVEVQASGAVDPSALVGRARSGDVVVLEDRPGVGALMRVAPDVARGIGSGPGSPAVLQRRPGFVLVVGDAPGALGRPAPIIAGLAVLAACVLVAAIAWRRRGRAARMLAR